MAITNREAAKNKIIELITASSKIIADAEITKELPGLEPQLKANIINELLKQGQITLHNSSKGLCYGLNATYGNTALLKCDNDEKLVYQMITQADNKGIWVRDIRMKAQLTQPVLKKILKALETKKLIKSVKSVEGGKKIFYMDYALQPDVSLTGGIFYDNQAFESEFVDVLNQQCYKCLEQKREAAKNYAEDGPMAVRNAQCATLDEIKKYIAATNVIINVDLSKSDMEKILNTLIYDGKVQRMPSIHDESLYRAIIPLVENPGLMYSPCGFCPVMKTCCDVGHVTPIKCLYMKEWIADSMKVEKQLSSMAGLG